MATRVRDLMRPPVTITPHASVVEAARLMREKNIGWLIVTTGQQPIGIVTEQDLINKVMAAGLFTESTNVTQIMTSKLVVGTPEMTVNEAIDVMNKHTIRRLPIVENEKLVGVFTSREVFATLSGRAFPPPPRPLARREARRAKARGKRAQRRASRRR